MKKIGLIIGNEKDWPDAFIQAIGEKADGATAELVKLGGTYMDEPCPYDVIIDRISYEIPYYRAYLQYAMLQGCFIISNPFTWNADSKFVGTTVINKLNFRSPRTVLLPNKNIENDMGPDGFQNLKYPMDWQGIVDYVGVPAIFKNIHSGGRHVAFRVHNLDELIQQYDESGTLTMVLQQLIESDVHIHCFVIGQEQVLPLRYSLENGRYLPGIMAEDEPLCQQIVSEARSLTQAYHYDINMVEFVIKDNIPYVINSTNPTPVMDRQLMEKEQFDWCIEQTMALALERAKRPFSQKTLFNLLDE